jgi:DNA-nicking Smr family endonuclease
MLHPARVHTRTRHSLYKEVDPVARRKKKKINQPPQSAVTPPLHEGPLEHNPFKALVGLQVQEPVQESKTPLPEPISEVSDEALFQEAMAEVLPLDRDTERLVGPGPMPRRVNVGPLVTEDEEVLAHLENLVSGHIHFDIVDSDEYLEGYARGVSPVILEKLRKGRFSVQAYLDLHGLTVREATEAVREFIAEASALRYRCVLLIHGRGLNSKDQIPVLKKKLETILLRGPVRKKILAFSSARPHDGGAGASYVLLRAKR